ncbi:MAG: hypothetical protein KatS3mg034_1041 [Vicingaceae bacterium]|nr:MAG: hypothetical protein KatS3mg034_1041 [Vicingaceae bacterium]
MVQIPNVFTPNNDGVNDVFSIKVEGAKEINADIFNRWGEIVYRYTTTIQESPATIYLWDGHTPAGVQVSDGVYFYLIQLTDMKDEIKTVNGTINVFR